MRIACLLIRNLAVQVASTDASALRGQPLVIGGLPFEAKPVYDASSEAMIFGINVGMPLHQAYALCPEAKFLASDERRYEKVFWQVADVMEGFSPLVDIEGLGCAYLDVSGIRNEQSLAHNIVASISGDIGLSACLGISSGKFFSRVAAFTSRTEAPVIIKQRKEKEFIAPFVIDFLPCSAKTRERLQLLGIRFIGQLSQFSEEALLAQFGSDGILIYELAHGIDWTPLVPRPKLEVILDIAELEPPADTCVEVLQSCQIMLDKLLSSVRAQGKLCRELQVKVIFDSGALQERRLPLKEATSSRAALLRRLGTWLEGIKFPAPAVEMELSLYLARDDGRELYLWPEHQKVRREFVKTASELKLRFGYQPIKKVQVVEPKAVLPERRFRLIDLLE